MTSSSKNGVGGLARAFSNWRSNKEATETQRFDVTTRNLTNHSVPVFSFPYELLVKIFQILRDCDDQEWAENHSSVWDDTKPFSLPYLVVTSHVSRHFRGIALAAPHLWAHINFSSSFPIGYLDEMLKRSSTTLLHLQLFEENHLGVSKMTSIMLDKVLSKSHRWQLLSITMTQPTTVQRMSTILATPLPYLQTLTVHNPGTHSWLYGSLATDAPSLTSLNLLGIDLLSCYPAAINSLTSLKIETFGSPDLALDFDALTQVLSLAARLVQLSFKCEIRESPRSPGSTIFLPELRSLQVIFEVPPQEDCIASIYSIFDAPKLEALKIIPCFYFPGPHDRVLVDYIKANGRSRYPNLRQLEVSEFDAPQYIDQDFFLALPFITHAGIIGFSSDAVLWTLASEESDNSSSMLWPHLKHLEVKRFDIDLLCDLVRRRIDSGKPLDSIEIYKRRDDTRFKAEKISWLKERVVLRVHNADS